MLKMLVDIGNLTHIFQKTSFYTIFTQKPLIFGFCGAIQTTVFNKQGEILWQKK